MPVGIKYAGKFSDRAGLPRLVNALPGFLRDFNFDGMDGTPPGEVADLIAGTFLTVHGAPTISGGMLVHDGVDDYTDSVFAHFDAPFTRVVRGRLLGSGVSQIIQGSTAASQSAIGTESTAPQNFWGYRTTRQYAGPLVDNLEHTFIFTCDNAETAVFSVDGVEYTTQTSGTGGVPPVSNGVTGLRHGASSSAAIFYNVAIRRSAVANHFADATERAAIRALVGIPG